MLLVVGLSHQDGGLSARSNPDLKLSDLLLVTEELSLACKEAALSLGTGAGRGGLDGIEEALRGGSGGRGGGSLEATMRFW